jgi:hypothetical protein
VDFAQAIRDNPAFVLQLADMIKSQTEKEAEAYSFSC